MLTVRRFLQIICHKWNSNSGDKVIVHINMLMLCFSFFWCERFWLSFLSFRWYLLGGWFSFPLTPFFFPLLVSFLASVLPHEERPNCKTPIQPDPDAPSIFVPSWFSLSPPVPVNLPSTWCLPRSRKRSNRHPVGITVDSRYLRSISFDRYGFNPASVFWTASMLPRADWP